MELLATLDPPLASCLRLETDRQENSLEMIASESVQPEMALELAGSVFNNKTAVGLPGHQRLMGSHYADQLERLAAQRACEVFGADHANMLTYSGSSANYCAYSAVLSLGDRVLAMDPSAGAHQTHGAPKNISAKMYQFAYFGLHPDTMLIDYDAAERMAREHKPKLIVIGSASYSRNIDFERMADIAHRNGALLMTDIAHFSGLVAAGITPNPVRYADIVTASTTKTMCGPHSGFILCKRKLAERVDAAVYPGNLSSLHLQTIAAMAYALLNSQTPAFRELMRQVVRNAQSLCDALIKRGFGIVTGGTDCHMFVADLRPFGAEGEPVAQAMQNVGLSVNTKAIPYDTSPSVRGLRAGTTVLTQRGMREEEMETVADLWLAIVRHPKDASVLKDVRERILLLTRRFPLPK